MKYYSEEQKMSSRKHLQRAVDIAGSQSQLARDLSEKLNKTIYQGHVRKWLMNSKVIPDYICKPVEEITNGQVKRSQLRPDLWDKKEVA